MSKPISTAAIVITVLAVAAGSLASDLDDRLNQRLRGAWAVLEVEVYSGCSGTYSDNQVGNLAVASKAANRFEPGELVKIDKVNAKRQRVDLLLSLAVPLRIARTDGPFELFDERQCQVQLIVPIPREQIKAGDDGFIMTRIEELMAPFSGPDEARDSDGWNGREPEPLPDDYDETLQRYAVWKAEQTNAAVAQSMRTALDDAADVAEDLSDDDDYLAGFAAGAEKMSDFSITECSSLLSASFSYHDTSPAKDKPKRWRDGWRDGQELIFNVLVAERLQQCMVPVPPPPLP